MRKTNSILIVAAILSFVAVPRAVSAPAAKWRLERESKAYGLKLPADLPAAVEGPLSFSVSAKGEAELTVSLTDLGTKAQVDDLASMRRSGSSWLVELGFPASGKYRIAIFGKLSSSSGPGVELATATVECRASKGSFWAFSPAFARLGLMVEEAPPLEVGDRAAIVIAAPKDVNCMCDFRSAAGKLLNSGVSIRREARGWNVDVAFPDSGAYSLSLYAKAPEMGDYTGVARVRFQAKVLSDPSSMLARATLGGDLEGMRAALAAKADPNVPVRAYRSSSAEDGTKLDVSGPPIFAVLSRFGGLNKQLEALKLLKAAGADFRARSSEGETIIVESFAKPYIVGRNEVPELLKALLAMGADPREPSDNKYTLNGKPAKASLSALLELESYCYGRESELAPCIPMLIAAGANPRSRWPWGTTALESLFKDYEPRKKPLVLAYLAAGVDPDPEELHALAQAIVRKKLGGDFDLVDRVLAASKDVNAPNDVDQTFCNEIVGYFGTSALSSADRRKLLDLFKARGGDFNSSRGDSETPLMAALSSTNMEGFDDLVARGADPRVKSARGRTLFFYLPTAEDPKTVAGLIDRLLALGLDINARDSRGDTAFHYFVSPNTSLDFLKLLVSKGANPAIPDRDGLTAYGDAKSLALKPIAAYLETLKVPATIGGWPVGNKSPACKAVLAADLDAIASLPASAFAETVARSSDGIPSTALHLAAEEGNAKVLSALAARKADWNAKDYFGRRPLELAVLAGKAEAVLALMAAGADPNAADDNGWTPLARAVAARSPLAKLMLDAGAKPDWRSLAFVSAISATAEEAKRLSGGSWGEVGVDAMADFGRTDLLAAFGPTIKHDTKELPELLQRAKDQTTVFDAYDKKAAIPLAGEVLPPDQRERKGAYSLTLDSWSPWMDVDPILDLKKYPIAVYVPEEYDGSKPYGLVISMMNAKGSSQQPKPEYLASLSARHLLYVGFDPYNRVFEDGYNDAYRFNNHERLVLAAVYRMLGAYSVDRGRIYLTGFSWGGRLTGEIVPKWPNVFSGGIAVCGCFTSGERLVPSYRYGRDRVTIVGASSDWDYNRAETRNGCNLLASLGYETYYLQDPQKWHSRISGENFEKALGFLDAAAARRAAAKK